MFRALGLLGLAVLAGCSHKTTQRSTRVPVTVARAESRSIPFEITATGIVEPQRTAAVGSQVGGMVTAIGFREGDEVAAGHVLFQLDPRPFRAQVAQVSATLARDRAQWRSAALDLDRAEKLRAQDVISAEEYDQKRAAADALHATLRADSANVASMRLDLQYATIRAPITGRTGKLNVHVGDLIKAATTDPLVTINQLHPIRVRFTVSQNDVPMVQRYRNGHPRVLVRPSGTSGGAPIEGTLAFVDNSVDPSTGTLLLKGEFANREGALWPGEFVEVRLVLFDEPNALVVPAPAVTNGQQGTYVYVLKPDSTVAPQPVRVERNAGELAVIGGGLSPGATVITDGQFRLSPGAKVQVRASADGNDDQ